MQRLDLTVLARGTGIALQDALVTIYATGTVVKATLYSENDVTSAEVANPITTGAYGQPATATYVPNGVYDIRIDKSGEPTRTIAEVEIYDLSELAASIVGVGPLATLEGAGNQLPYFAGINIVAVTDFYQVGRNFLAATTTAEQLAVLGVDPATYQPLDADLTAIAALATTAYGRGFLPIADAAAARAYIGAGTGTGDLVAANNLSDLASIATARANLGLSAYYVPFGFGVAPTASQTLLVHTFAQTVNFAANLAGSVGTAGTNPAADFLIDVRKNGASVGTITVAAAGGTTFATAGGAAVAFAAGDRLKCVAPAGVDATIADVGITLNGTRG